MRILGKGRFSVALLAAALLVGLVSEAGAWSYGSWGSSGSYGSAGSYGSSGSYGSYGGSSGSWGSYGSSASYGSYGRVGIVGRIRARHAARHSAGSYGSYGSSGSWGSSGSSASYGSYGSSGSSASYGGAVYSTPVETECEGCTAEATTDQALKSSGSAVVEVTVPADAKVFVNDKATTSTGNSRSYVSNSLQAGQTYMYNFRVEFQKDGKDVVKNESVKLNAGDRVALTFDAKNEMKLSSAVPAAKTELKLSVPANAKVFLAGAETSQTGTDRTYATSRLAEGETWNGYTVRVELEQDGETVVREETLTMKGGKSYELAFDFEQADDHLAAK